MTSYLFYNFYNTDALRSLSAITELLVLINWNQLEEIFLDGRRGLSTRLAPTRLLDPLLCVVPFHDQYHGDATIW